MEINKPQRTCQVAVKFNLWNRMLGLKSKLSTEDHVYKLKELLERAIEEFLERQEERVVLLERLEEINKEKEGKNK